MIETGAETLRLNKLRGGKLDFTVTNQTGRAHYTVCRVYVDPAQPALTREAFTLLPEADSPASMLRFFEPDAARSYHFTIRVPPTIPSGLYPVRFVVADEDNPDDVYGVGQVTLRVYKPFNWLRWILVALIILVSAFGFIATREPDTTPRLVVEQPSNLLAGPDDSYTTIATLEPSTLEITGYNENPNTRVIWYQVALPVDENQPGPANGWLPQNAGTVENDYTTAPAVEVPPSLLVSGTTTITANLLPDRASPVVGQITERTRLPILSVFRDSQNDEWYLVSRAFDQTGWLRRQFGISVVLSEAARESVSLTGTPATAVFIAFPELFILQETTLRDRPATDAAVLTPLTTGRRFRITGQFIGADQSRWYLVTLEDPEQSGWIQHQPPLTAFINETNREIQTFDAANIPTVNFVPTATPTASPTNTATATSSATPTNTPTDRPSPSPTQMPRSTNTAVPTNTPVPTRTPTNPPTFTPTSSPTSTPTNPPTFTPTSSPTSTPTDIPTNTPGVISPFATNTPEGG